MVNSPNQDHLMTGRRQCQMKETIKKPHGENS